MYKKFSNANYASVTNISTTLHDTNGLLHFAGLHYMYTIRPKKIPVLPVAVW